MQARVPPRVHTAVRLRRGVAGEWEEGDVPGVPRPADDRFATDRPLWGADARRDVHRGEEKRRAPREEHLVAHRPHEVHEQHQGGDAPEGASRDALGRGRAPEQGDRVLAVHVHDRHRGVASEKGKVCRREAVGVHAGDATRGEFESVQGRPERQRDPDVAQVRRRGVELAGRQLRLRARAVVEPRGGDAGGDARASHRTETRGDRGAIFNEEHHRGAHDAAAGEETARVRGVHGREPGELVAAHRGRFAVFVQAVRRTGRRRRRTTGRARGRGRRGATRARDDR
mmetsp:Transcript_6851/g.25226  ORF Transcript_6851/g.25226 Transcript_6851/m.25226 type:complete len:285 (+) Transcript_6851:1628-2482(+)